jgi:hypothetical protein
MSYEISISNNWGAAIAPALPGVPCRDIKVVIFSKSATGWAQHSLVTVPGTPGSTDAALFLEFAGNQLLVKARRSIDATVSVTVAIFGFDGQHWVKLPNRAASNQTPAPIIPLLKTAATPNPLETLRKRVTDMYQILMGVYKPVA